MADVESRYKKPENYVNRELSWLDFEFWKKPEIKVSLYLND